MLAAESEGTPSIARMMSPPRTNCSPPTVKTFVPPTSPASSPGEPLATLLTRKPFMLFGTLRMSSISSERNCPSMPPQKDFFSSRSCCAVFIVTTKPSPSLPPDFEMLWLTMPITSPAALNIGPPELPVLIVALVWKNSARGMARCTVLGARRHPLEQDQGEIRGGLGGDHLRRHGLAAQELHADLVHGGDHVGRRHDL